jgi:SpoVK/Ycf46/Vps4 family AAA+-type ATPase
MEEDQIREDMLKERREWIQEVKTQKGGKPPEDVKGFYERVVKEDDKDDEGGEGGDDDEDAKGKKGKKEEPKKGKGKKGAAAGEDDDDKQIIKIGPSEVIQKYDEFYEDYNNIWANKDESENYQQHFDRDMARGEMLPVVQDELKKRVDDMLKIELENMRLIAGIKAKKKKKGKKKGKKKKKKKGPKLPGLTKAFWDIPMKTHLENLVKENIVRKVPERSLTSFIGEFNYLHSMLDNIKDCPYDPSMALIRQLVTEYIIFPLGSELVRKRHPAQIKSFLFYGPSGSGKTHVVEAIASETNSIVLDLSPVVLERAKPYLGGGKKKDDELIATVMFVAKEYQPSIIYIDEAEKVWPAKKKGKKGKKPKKDPNAPQRIKKTLAKWKGKFVEDDFRITIIGCTSEPESCSKKEFKKFFDKSIYFPFPDYSTRRLMWKSFIEELGGLLRADFPLSTLAHISHGYSAGSIRKSCEAVLTKYRRSSVRKQAFSLTNLHL